MTTYDGLDNEDLYVKYKKLQQQLEFLEVQEEYIKVRRDFRRNILRYVGTSRGIYQGTSGLQEEYIKVGRDFRRNTSR